MEYEEGTTGFLTERDRKEALVRSLEEEFAPMKPHIREIAQFMAPYRARLDPQDRQRGDKRHQKIFDGFPQRAVRIFRTGLSAATASSISPWFELTDADPDLAEFPAVKRWFHTATQRMQAVLGQGNAYSMLGQSYGDKGLWGTSSMTALNDTDKIVHCDVDPIGTYAFGQDHKRKPNVKSRRFEMTALEILEQFGWDHTPGCVRKALQGQQLLQRFEVIHLIEPNRDFNSSYRANRHKRFSNCIWLAGEKDEDYLEESGFDDFPGVIGRWERAGDDIWGTSPAMEALADVKSLMTMRRKGFKALDKIVDPPTVGPPRSTVDEPVKTGPNQFTSETAETGRLGIRAMYEVKSPLAELREWIGDAREDIGRCFSNDFFMMLAQSDRRLITAREIDERHQEKLWGLSPMIENIYSEDHDPLLGLVFNKMARRGLFPRAPDELQGRPIKINYIHLLAQAQRLAGIANYDRFIGTFDLLGKMNPAVVFKLKFNPLVDEIARKCGIAPTIIASDDEAREAQAEQQRAQQAAQNAANAPAVAKAVGDMAAKPMAENSVLSRLTAALGGAAN